MRRFCLALLLLPLAACADDEPVSIVEDDTAVLADEAVADEIVTDDVTDAATAEVATEAVTVAVIPTADNLAGDWVYCDGMTPLDTSFILEDGEVSTYIQDRPGTAGRTFTVEAGELVLGDGARYPATLDGDVLTLLDDGEAGVYARSAAACPAS